MKNIILICAAILLFSCSNENNIELDRDDGGLIVLNLKPNDISSKTRASEAGDDLLNENKIENMYVFFFAQNAPDNEQCIGFEFFSGLSFQGTGTFSKDLTTSQNLFTAGVTYDIYTIVNLPTNVTIPSPITLGAIKSLRTVTPITSSALQNSFIMDGKVSAILKPISPTAIVNVNVPLKRAVSKVRVKFVLAPNSVVDGATVAQVSLRNFAKKGSLLDNNAHALTVADYDNSSYVTSTPSSTFTFYCYENNWGETSSDETYLMANIPYSQTSSNYYRIPINKYANSTETGRIERNMIYDVVVYIDNYGSNTEYGAVVINSNCVIIDWTTKSIVLKTISQHYLGVSEYDIVMPNISTYTINYVSDLPISIININAKCTQYSTTGVQSTVTYSIGQPQFPTFTVNSSTNTITINSAIPINYVPKNMSFTVTNNLGLNLNVSIVQYPSRYVTARLSTGNIKPELFSGGTNFNLFTVNTLVPSTNGAYTLGDPTNGFDKTDSTAIGNKMVSPRFIIASQYGVYTRADYTKAQTRCFLYGEDIYRSGWRMPTKAEIELVNIIQDDPNSAVKALLMGDAYWSAYKYDYYNFANNYWINSTSTGTAFVRAVYDLYKNEQ